MKGNKEISPTNSIKQTISNNLSFLLAPKDVKQSFSFLRNTLDGQFIIHSFNSFFWQFFLHMILVRIRISSPKFQKESSMKYWFRFANTCYFERYSKLQIPKFQTRAIFHFSFKYNYFFPKTFSLKSSTTSSSQIFQNLVF